MLTWVDWSGARQRARRSRRYSPVASFHLSSPSLSPTVIQSPRVSTSVTFQDALEIVSVGQETLQEWNKRWGTGANLSHRAVNSFFNVGLIKVPAERARGEITDMVRRGREVLLRLESIGFIDLHSIRANEFQDFWIKAIRVIEGLHERVAQADVVLQRHLDVQTH
jgi:hypothetical protein